MTEQSENLAAIDRFFQTTKAITPKAAAVQTDWLVWYPKLNFLQKSVTLSIYDEARARRNLFNLSNVRSAQEQANVQAVLDRGITSEDLSGQSPSQVAKAKAAIATIQKKLDVQGSTHPTIKQGSSGDAVKEWQKIIGVNADAKFGPGTHTKTIAFQKSKGLTGDGVVGSKTWAAALGVKTPETAKTDQAVASLPSIFSPLPRTVPTQGPGPKPTVNIPKPSTAAILAAGKAGPAPATTVASKGGEVTGVKLVGESKMPDLVATASMIPSIPNPLTALKKLPTWGKWALGIGSAVLTVFGIKKTVELSQR
jgi:hypothetical protein